MKKIFFLNVTFMLLLFTSCEKEIFIDLNSSKPKVVVEGNLSNLAEDSTIVKLTKTINLNESVANPTVNNAVVTIVDNTVFSIDTLSEIRPGIYYNKNVVGFEGHRYTLNVLDGVDLYSSTTVMPYSIPLDTITLYPISGPTGPPGGKQNIFLLPIYKDEKNVRNNYQLIVLRNDSLLKNIDVRNDLIIDGEVNKRPVRVAADKKDKITIDLQCIDGAVFDYFTGLSTNLGQFSATPSNPKSNISNGALGYFKVHTSSKKNFIVK